MGDGDVEKGDMDKRLHEAQQEYKRRALRVNQDLDGSPFNLYSIFTFTGDFVEIMGDGGEVVEVLMGAEDRSKGPNVPQSVFARADGNVYEGSSAYYSGISNLPRAGGKEGALAPEDDTNILPFGTQPTEAGGRYLKLVSATEVQMRKAQIVDAMEKSLAKHPKTE